MRPVMNLLTALALYLLSLVLRSLPGMFSGQPFNIDGYGLARLSEDMVASGQWSLYPTMRTTSNLYYNSTMPLFPAMLSEFSLLFGLTPLDGIKLFVPMVSSAGVLLVYFVTYRVTRSYYAALGAGLFLALNGFSVYLGAASMKQVVAFALLPLVLYLYHNRRDARIGMLCAALLLMLPLAHHLTSLVAFTAVSMMFFSTLAREYGRGLFDPVRWGLDLVMGPAIVVFAMLYYTRLGLIDSGALPFYRPLELESMALYGSVFVILCLVAMYVSSMVPRSRPAPFFTWYYLFPLIGIGVLYFNMNTKVFQGTITTSPELLRAMIPYMGLLMAVAVGLRVAANRATEFRPLVLSMVCAPLVLMLYAMFMGLDPPNFNLVYRSFGFLDPGFAVCIGIGLGYLVSVLSNVRLDVYVRGEKTRGLTFRRWVVPAMVAFTLVCLATTPLALNQEKYFGFRSVTWDSEFDTGSWTSAHLQGRLICTDQYMADMLGPYFELETERSLPFDLREGRGYAQCDALLIEGWWTVRGGQLYPFPLIKVPKTSFNSALFGNSAVYSTNHGADAISVLLVEK